MEEVGEAAKNKIKVCDGEPEYEEGRRGGGRGGGGGADRLSNLPDHIIQHILCLLDTKDAIKTSILSKTWRYHWNCLPVLNFNSLSFSRIDSFEKFVFSVLSGRRGRPATPISKLRFVCVSVSQEHKPMVGRVFRYVFDNRIEHLVMYASNARYLLPYQILTYRPVKTLEVCYFILPKSFCSSTVAVLRLTHCSFSAGRLRGVGRYLNPFAGCPNLNDLSLIDMNYKGCKVFKISAPELLSLTIGPTTWSNYGHLRQHCLFEISAPKLTSFSCETVSATMDFARIDLPCLQYVHIAFSLPFVRSKEAYLSLIKLLRGLHNAQFVTLTTSTIKALNTFPDMLENQPSPFNRLKSLKLKTNGECTSFMCPRMVMNYLCGGSPSVEVELI